MKQNKREQIVEQKQHGRIMEYELIKAVAQAWHSHFNNEKEATSEFDARRRNFRNKPTRFKLEVEATNKLKVDEEASKGIWNFNQSLWDPFEIVAVSKRLETGLVLNYDFDDLQKLNEQLRVFKKRKESKNSLRNLFNIMSSRRFSDDR
ncbi:uncharacterized protein [Spinacia oleracea]|uniref:Uncharacterized protein n=1 Tax=Spinacia oleracea TaxID=3562 RepID=A0A9R0HR52_SPIOL|nr:uncharacterized protein LOC110775079 [Spinacia oleracea]